jgi:hypothetical protein
LVSRAENVLKEGPEAVESLGVLRRTSGDNIKMDVKGTALIGFTWLGRCNSAEDFMNRVKNHTGSAKFWEVFEQVTTSFLKKGPIAAHERTKRIRKLPQRAS